MKVLCEAIINVVMHRDCFLDGATICVEPYPEPRCEKTGFFTVPFCPNPEVRARAETQEEVQVHKLANINPYFPYDFQLK